MKEDQSAEEKKMEKAQGAEAVGLLHITNQKKRGGGEDGGGSRC
jgi:hypothetical protein